MTGSKTDWLNIGMMVLSLALAVAMPFKLFILAYAVLGPLHYITEINWLEKKGFFIKDKKKYLLLVVMTLLIALPYTVYNLFGFKFEEMESSLMNKFLVFLQQNIGLFLVASFFLAIGLFYLRKYWAIMLVLLASFLVGILLTEWKWFVVIVGILLPTLIHVYLFTMFFMLYGSIKSKSQVGYLSVILLILAPIAISMIDVDPRQLNVDPNIQNTFIDLNFSSVHVGLASLLGEIDESGMYSILSTTGIKIQMFIAFAYLYHYLNWFAKTTVIGWHKAISRNKLIVLLLIWAASVGLYFYNYKTGFVVLITLSFLHLVLEFPLNYMSIKEIGKSVKEIFVKA